MLANGIPYGIPWYALFSKICDAILNQSFISSLENQKLTQVILIYPVFGSLAFGSFNERPMPQNLSWSDASPNSVASVSLSSQGWILWKFCFQPCQHQLLFNFIPVDLDKCYVLETSSQKGLNNVVSWIRMLDHWTFMPSQHSCIALHSCT